jgi:cysteine-rich repeat protein
LVLFAAVLVGCWNGADSAGLACEDNTHCGLGLDCINGFCGGEPNDALCGNGHVDPGEACDDGQQNADNGACRTDCTLEVCGDGVQGPSEACDQGEQNDDEGMCKTDCMLATCGDGFVAPTEPCDDGNTDPGDGCSPTCTLESCGNGTLEPGEDCDDGGESPTCNDDCTAADCGDAKLNAAAGEACDNGDANGDYLCMNNCTIPLLWDDMEPDTPTVEWDTQIVSGAPIVENTWSVSPRNAEGTRSWDSGMPAAGPGEIRLVTPELDLGSLTGETIELRFRHAREFTDCDTNLAYEGAVVEVSRDGGPYEVITPDDGYTGLVYSTLCPAHPLAGQQAFTLDVGYTTETFDLSAYAGSSIQVGFRAGWDCNNCVNRSQIARGWFIDNVIVSLE